jgi:hypothetical protein
VDGVASISYPSSIPPVDMQSALQNDSAWKCLLFLLILVLAENLAGNICSKHRPLPRFESGARGGSSSGPQQMNRDQSAFCRGGL